MDLSETERAELDADLAEKQQLADQNGTPQPLMLGWAIKDTPDEIRATAEAVREYALAKGVNLVKLPRGMDELLTITDGVLQAHEAMRMRAEEKSEQERQRKRLVPLQKRLKGYRNTLIIRTRKIKARIKELTKRGAECE